MSIHVYQRDVVVETEISTKNVYRGPYNEIKIYVDRFGVKHSASSIIEKFKAVLPETFVEFDRKMRGDSLNLDLYGYDEEQGVAIIQIRHFFKRYAKGFANIHKDYVLVGQNEITNDFFRHPVSGHAVHAAIRKDASDAVAPVRAAQRWMWNVTEKQLEKSIRQGDILMVPSRKPSEKHNLVDTHTVVVGGSHEIRSTKIHARYCGDDVEDVIAWCPTVVHTKDQHDPIFAEEERFYSIRVAQEAATWEWGARLGD